MNFQSTWPSYSSTMIDNIVNILESGKVNQWTGNKVNTFQNVFAEYFDVKHAVAVFNGSVAIELCLRAIQLESGDEVIVTPRSFIASASSITICGGIPIFVDIDPNSQNITLDNIKKAVTSKTKAVILVHLSGWPCDVIEIVKWCHEHNIYVIEDCAQSHGSKYMDKYLGTFGDINAWSFCQDKIISTAGEGGMVTTNNTELFKKAWSYKDHGKNLDKINQSNPSGMFRWIHDTIGTNWRMTEIQASIGIDSLIYLDDWIKHRRRSAEIYNNELEKLDICRLTIPDNKYYHSYYKYYFFINDKYIINDETRDNIIKQIRNENIPCFQGSCSEINKELAFDINVDLPVAKQLFKTSIMLLVDPTISHKSILESAKIIKKILKKEMNQK